MPSHINMDTYMDIKMDTPARIPADTTAEITAVPAVEMPQAGAGRTAPAWFRLPAPDAAQVAAFAALYRREFGVDLEPPRAAELAARLVQIAYVQSFDPKHGWPPPKTPTSPPKRAPASPDSGAPGDR